MSEGRRGIGFVTIAALVIAVAAGAAAGYVFQRHDKALDNIASQLKEIRDGQNAAVADRKTLGQQHTNSVGVLNKDIRSLWKAMRGIQGDIRKVDDRLGKLEDKSGSSAALEDIRKRLKAMSTRTVLLQARVEALERRAGSRSKTIIVPGGGNATGGNAPPATGPRTNQTAGRTGTTGSAATTGRANQPPFWNGCIDSLNKSARLATSAESVCDCIIGRIKNSENVSAKDRGTILGQRQFTTRVRGVSASSQKVLEQSVVQCALRQFKNKKK
jgi:hypothetical protein